MSTLDGFILVMLGGQILVGKREPAIDLAQVGDRLSPAYELHLSAKVDAQGRAVGIVRHLVPILMADVPYVNLPESYAWLPVSALSGPMQRELERGAAMAEETRGKIKLGELGLVPADGGTR